MKVITVITVILALSSAQHIRTRFINQPVDHFNFLNIRNFDQRYFQNEEFFEEGGPIFIFLTAGERNFGVYDEFIRRGLVYEIAEETNGMLFALEHRYFGQSRPTPDTTLGNLQFLNLHQVLADIATFINFVKRNSRGTENSRVILWGSGYAGSLAIWARQKYPNLIDGAWGSSAPLNADFLSSEIMENAFQTIRNIGGPECGDTIDQAFLQIHQELLSGNTSSIMQRFRICEELDTSNIYDIARLDYTLSTQIYDFVQTTRYPDVDEKCRIITGADTPDDPPSDALEGFARWYIDDRHPNRDCFDYRNEAIIQEYSDANWDSMSTIGGLRQNLWLQCTQLGWFPIRNQAAKPDRFFRRWCADAFNNQLFLESWYIEDLIDRTNQFFGGLNPNTQRILITQGAMDPARTLSPLNDLNPQARVFVINLESFSRDMGSPSDVQDLPHLLEVKENIREEILGFIRDADENQPSPYKNVKNISGVAY